MSTKSTKYFFDTEFIEGGRTIDLISIGIVSEDGRRLYRQNTECAFNQASEWVWRNVFPHLLHFEMRGKRACNQRTESYDPAPGKRYFTRCHDRQEDPCPWATRREIRDAVLEFCSIEKYGKPEFWGYYADYDWVVLCQMFGPMVALPKGFPMYCRDIKQLADSLGNPTLPEQKLRKHDALCDALWTKEAYEFLMVKQAQQFPLAIESERPAPLMVAESGVMALPK